MKEELQDQVAAGGQLFLEAGDLLQRVLLLLVESALIPALIENMDAAAGRRPCPEPPHEGAHRLVFVRVSDGEDLESARIQGPDEPPDQGSLSGGSPALEEDYHRDPQGLAPSLRQSQSRLHLFPHCLKFFFGNLLFQVDFVQHTDPFCSGPIFHVPPPRPLDSVYTFSDSSARFHAGF